MTDRERRVVAELRRMARPVTRAEARGHDDLEILEMEAERSGFSLSADLIECMARDDDARLENADAE